jgi:aminopeptidase N
LDLGYVEGKRGQVTVQPMTVRIHEQEQALYFPLPKKPDFISFDVGNHYTKTVKLEYPYRNSRPSSSTIPTPSRAFLPPRRSPKRAAWKRSKPWLRP